MNELSKRNGSPLKFIMPVLLMIGVQILTQLFGGQIMFFYKGYTYTEGTYDEFMAGYQEALVSNNFNMIITIGSTLILAIVFLFWYRREIVHAANVSLRNKCKVIGVLDFKFVPGVILTGIGLGIFATFVVYFVTMVKPDMVSESSDIAYLINSGDMGNMNIFLIIYFCFLSPVCQELAFRGLTLGFAERRMSFMAANVVQALLFGAFSMNFVQVIYYFVFGMVLGYVYYRTENILIPIACNIIFCITRLIFMNVNVIYSSVVISFIVLLAAMAAAYAGVVLIKRSKISRTDNEDKPKDNPFA